MLTHHHVDHVAGTEDLRERYGVKVVGATADAHRLPKLDQAWRRATTWRSAARPRTCWTRPATPAATSPTCSTPSTRCSAATRCSASAAAGCWKAPRRTCSPRCRSSPSCRRETLVYCGHEYTESNARFALHAIRNNAALQAYAAGVRQKRAAGQATVPSRLADELAANPFLRAPDVATLADLRAAQGQVLKGFAVKLFHSPASPFVRKVMASPIAREIDAQIELVPANPHASPPALLAANPLSKVPCLITEDGVALFDSPVICEYLDALDDGALPLFPRAGGARWRALKLQALADGIMDAAVSRRGELPAPEGGRARGVMARQKAAVDRGVAALEADPPHQAIDIGSIAVGCALGYLDFRFPPSHGARRRRNWRRGLRRSARTRAWQDGAARGEVTGLRSGRRENLSLRLLRSVESL